MSLTQPFGHAILFAKSRKNFYVYVRENWKQWTANENALVYAREDHPLLVCVRASDVRHTLC